jgi:serine/threonine protein kinase
MKFLKRNTKEHKESRQTDESTAASKVAKRSTPRPDPRVPLPGNTNLEGYNFERVIGRGSFSLVYRAVELSTGNEVVIKEYFPKHFSIRKEDHTIVPLDGRKLFTFSEGFKQFFSEAMALNKIKHPHVLKTNNMFRANKTAYLVSLNIGGRDLKWFLSTVKTPMNEALVLKVFMPILSALNFLHGAQLLHLDIKPANILLQPNSESLLLDFGAAQRMNSSKRINNMQTLTHGFAPPEQYDKHKSLGPWTDIYAVAATLYYGIACNPPAKSKNSDTESRLDLKKYSDRYEPHLLQAVNRSLTYDPATRYDNVDEFAAALLAGSKWKSLREYETDVMKYDRFMESARDSQRDLAQAVA